MFTLGASLSQNMLAGEGVNRAVKFSIPPHAFTKHKNIAKFNL